MFPLQNPIIVTREQVVIGKQEYPIQPDMFAFINTLDSGINPHVPAILTVGR